MIIRRPGKEEATLSDVRPLHKTRVIEAAVSKPDALEAATVVGGKVEPVRPDKPGTPLVARRSPGNIAGASGASTAQPDSAMDKADHDTVKPGQITGTTHPKSRDRAIQLGEDVRLPAAIIAVNDPETRAGDISPAIAAATKEIENTFYRELAEKAREEPSVDKDSTVGGSDATAQVPPVVTGETEDPDTVILSEHDVYDARERADAVYRTIHGDEAANRRGISSALEVGLTKDVGPVKP